MMAAKWFATRATTSLGRSLLSMRGMASKSVFDSSRLVGKTALITGASSGIGAATATLFARAGANVVLLARRKDALAEVAKSCEAELKDNGYDGRVTTLQADMQDRSAIDNVVSKLAETDIDILVNNAGLVRGREHVGEVSNDDVDVMFQTNVIGLFHLTQAMVRKFKQRDSGMIINLGSVAGIEPYAGGSIYCATKAAVASFTGALRSELVNTAIRVAEVQPGMVETEFSVVRYRGDAARAGNEYDGLTPLTGADIAEEIVWVASRPPHVQIANMLIFPTNQASATINYRKPKA